MRLAEVRQETQVVAADRSARKEPRAGAEQLVELDELAVADEDPVLAHQGLHQALKLAEDLRREEQGAVAQAVVGTDCRSAAEEVRQVRVRFQEVVERALAFDSDVVASVIQNIDVLKDRFATLMRETAPQYHPLTRGWDDKAKERAIEYFADQQQREAFFAFFRQTQNLYDILSPDAFLRPFMDDYLALAELYGLIRNAFTDRIYIDKEFTAKTRELLELFRNKR